MKLAASVRARRSQLMGRPQIIGLAAALTTAASISITGLVSAAPLEHGDFHHAFSNVVTDFCDVPGLTVHVEGVVDGRILVNPHGPDGLIYFLEHVQTSRVLTNLANRKTISDDTQGISKDLDVIDNGDGTLTVTVLATGNFTVYGADGSAIARDPGQVRFELLIDHSGTPTDPFDDVELVGGLANGPTGRSDDFCEAAVAALT
jgi:hypothetical protein